MPQISLLFPSLSLLSKPAFTKRMAILKEFQDRFPDVAIDDLEVIAISDDDTDDSDDDYEFEDVPGINGAASMVDHIDAAEEEVLDDGTIGDDEALLCGVQDKAWCDTSATHAPTPEAGGACEVGDEPVDNATTPHDDAVEGHEWSVQRDGEEDSTKKTINPDHNDVAATPSTDLAPGDLIKSFTAELAALRSRVTQLESQQSLYSTACAVKTPSKKRKQKPPANHRTKRAKRDHIVNISTTRVYVHWDETSERCAYTWRRGRGGRCWVSDDGVEERREVDGEFLMCCATDMSVEIRANADWLPIELRFNEDTQVFEGEARVGSRRLEVDDSVMMDMIYGGKDEHVALVSYL